MFVEIGPYEATGERRVNVVIHDYDTWCCSTTLCKIIEPLLLAGRESFGSAYIEMSDVPKRFHTYCEQSTEIEDGHFWNCDAFRWIVDEIIYAANAINRDWENEYLSYSDEDYLKDQARITNGFRLMGKYFEALWN